MGHAVVKAGKRTAAAIKRKNLQNKVKRMITERFTIQDLKDCSGSIDSRIPLFWSGAIIKNLIMLIMHIIISNSRELLGGQRDIESDSHRTIAVESKTL